MLIVGAGFIGSEMASVCRDLGLNVTVAERSSAPLVGALGGVIGDIAAKMQRDAGVDLRTGVAVEALEGDADGHVRRAKLSDGTTLDVDVVVASLGSIRNIEWLEGARLASGFWGVACDAGCRAFDINGVVTDNIFVAGDIARAPHVLYEYQFMAMEHWDNAVLGAQVAATTWSASRPDAARTCRCRVLVGPVRRQHQRRRRVLLRRRNRVHPGLARGPPLRRRLRPPRPHRRAVTFNHGKWLEYYGGNDRAIRPVSASTAGLSTRQRTRSRSRPGSRSARPDRDSRRGSDRPRSHFARCRVPPQSSLSPAKETIMTTPETAWAEAMKYENRPNPYPFFDELRKTPVVRVADKTYVVTGYRELLALAHDPHISSDVTRSPICLQPATRPNPRPAPRASTLTARSRASSCLTRRTTTGHAVR